MAQHSWHLRRPWRRGRQIGAIGEFRPEISTTCFHIGLVHLTPRIVNCVACPVLQTKGDYSLASSANGEHVDTTHDVRSGTAVLETVQHCIGATPHPRRLCAKRTAQKRERARRATAAETKHLPPAHTIHRAWPLLTGPRDNTARLTTPHLNRTTPPSSLLTAVHQHH